MDAPIRLTRGCYLPPGQPSIADQCAALLTTFQHQAVAVGTTAAALHGLWLPEPPHVLEFAACQSGRRPARMTRARRPEIGTHRRSIRTVDQTVRCGVPVTTLARTWWDLATDLSLPDLVAAGDRALRLGCRIAEIEELLRVMAGRRGNRRARIAAPLLDARSRSRPESHLRVAVRDGGLDCFEVNVPIFDRHGQWLAEPDLSCVQARIALEYQGIDHADPARMRADITRAADLRQRGWLMLAYGPAEVLGRPWQIVPELRELIRQRAPGLLATHLPRPPQDPS